jgi:hypothetical protein
MMSKFNANLAEQLNDLPFGSHHSFVTAHSWGLSSRSSTASHGQAYYNLEGGLEG